MLLFGVDISAFIIIDFHGLHIHEPGYFLHKDIPAGEEGSIVHLVSQQDADIQILILSEKLSLRHVQAIKISYQSIIFQFSKWNNNLRHLLVLVSTLSVVDMRIMVTGNEKKSSFIRVYKLLSYT